MFRLAAHLLPLLLIAVIEIGLRISGVGYDSRFFLPSRQLPGLIHQNDRFGRRFMPARLVRRPLPFTFAAQKPAGTFRIFVLGSSAAQGDPHPAYGFSRVLERMLANAFPQVRFEVINTAMVAMNSHVMRVVAREALQFQPDCLLVYLGNNEVVGPYGPASLNASFEQQPLYIACDQFLRATRCGQVLRSTTALAQEEPTHWQGMAMFLDRQFPADAPALQPVYRSFERNLDAILEEAHAAGVPAFMTTVPVNLAGCAPFGSVGRGESEGLDAEALSALLQRAQSSEARRALDTITALRAAHPASADLAYLDGHARLTLGDPSARTAFEYARDADPLRFRADGRINQVITASASRLPGITLVDAAAGLANQSLTTSGSQALFVDHVHLTLAGNVQVAALFHQPLLPIIKQRTGVEPATTTTLDIEQIAAVLGWGSEDELATLREMQQRFARPPFTYQLGHATDVQRLSSQSDALQAALAQTDPAAQPGRIRAALAAAPDDWQLHANLAASLIERNVELDQAALHLDRALELNPAAARVMANRGIVDLLRGQAEQALTFLNRTVELDPELDYAFNNRGNAFLALGRHAEAAADYQGATQLNPAYAEAWANLGSVREQARDAAEALACYRQALALQPTQARHHLAVARVLQQQGERTAALDAYSAAVLALEGQPAALAQLIPPVQEVAEAAEQSGAFLEAIRAWRLLLSLRPGHPEAMNNLAYRLIAGETADPAQQTEALDLARRAAKQTGYQQPAILDTLVAVHLARQEWAEARQWLAAATALVGADTDPALQRSLEQWRLVLEQQSAASK